MSCKLSENSFTANYLSLTFYFPTFYSNSKHCIVFLYLLPFHCFPIFEFFDLRVVSKCCINRFYEICVVLELVVRVVSACCINVLYTCCIFRVVLILCCMNFVLYACCIKVLYVCCIFSVVFSFCMKLYLRVLFSCCIHVVKKMMCFIAVLYFSGCGILC